MRRDQRVALARWFNRSGFTQREVAARLEISEAHLSHLVNGERTPSLDLALRISDLTGIPVAELARRVA